MLDRLRDADLISSAADIDRISWLSNWQVPMYDIDFARVDVRLEELKAAREAALYAEMGIYSGDLQLLPGLGRLIKLRVQHRSECQR